MHSANVLLADARKAGDAAAIQAAEAAVASAQAAVTQALDDGRVLSAAHILDLPLDCVAFIIEMLGEGHVVDTWRAADVARVCGDCRAAAKLVPIHAEADMGLLKDVTERDAWLAGLAAHPTVRHVTFKHFQAEGDLEFVEDLSDDDFY